MPFTEVEKVYKFNSKKFVEDFKITKPRVLASRSDCLLPILRKDLWEKAKYYKIRYTIIHTKSGILMIVL